MTCLPRWKDEHAIGLLINTTAKSKAIALYWLIEKYLIFVDIHEYLLERKKMENTPWKLFEFETSITFLENKVRCNLSLTQSFSLCKIFSSFSNCREFHFSWSCPLYACRTKPFCFHCIITHLQGRLSYKSPASILDIFKSVFPNWVVTNIFSSAFRGSLCQAAVCPETMVHSFLSSLSSSLTRTLSLFRFMNIYRAELFLCSHAVAETFQRNTDRSSLHKRLIGGERKARMGLS